MELREPGDRPQSIRDREDIQLRGCESRRIARGVQNRVFDRADSTDVESSAVRLRTSNTLARPGCTRCLRRDDEISRQARATYDGLVVNIKRMVSRHDAFASSLETELRVEAVRVGGVQDPARVVTDRGVAERGFDQPAAKPKATVVRLDEDIREVREPGEV
jgi:hypothetical protein